MSLDVRYQAGLPACQGQRSQDEGLHEPGSGSVGLLYMDHAEATEKTAWLHADDARSILEKGILAQGGLVLIDDHEIEQAAEEVSRDTLELPVSSVAKVLGRRCGDAHASQSRYSRRIFEETGFTVLAEDARQLLLLGAGAEAEWHSPSDSSDVEDAVRGRTFPAGVDGFLDGGQRLRWLGVPVLDGQ